MNRTKGFRTLLFLIIVALFNLTFFMLGGWSHPASVWTAYGFMHAAWLLLFVTPKFTRAAGRPLFGLPALTFAFICFAAEVIVGLIIILTRPVTVTVSLLIQIVIIGLFFAVLIGSLAADEHTAATVAERDGKAMILKDMAAEVKVLIGQLDDQNADKEIQRAYDLLHASPLNASERGSAYEPAIIDLIYDLKEKVENGNAEEAADTAKKLQMNIKMRNS